MNNFDFKGIKYTLLAKAFDFESYANLIIFKEYTSNNNSFKSNNLFIAPENFYNHVLREYFIPENFKSLKHDENIYKNGSRRYSILGSGFSITQDISMFICKGLYDSPLGKNILFCIDSKLVLNHI